MKERKLQILIGLMSFAVLGLIAIQFYWIANAIKLEEEKFKSTVNSALTEVTERLDKEQTTAVVVDKLTSRINNTFTIKGEHDGHVIYIDSKPIKKIKRGEVDKNDVKFEIKVGSTDTVIQKLGTVTSSKVANYTFIEKSDTDSLVIKKTELVEDVVDEIFSISTRDNKSKIIKREDLDTLLSETFMNKGIYTPFKFAIELDEGKHIENLSGVKEEHQWTVKGDNVLKEAAFKIRLFPNDLFVRNDFLVVNFPNKTEYILKNLAMMLSLSALIIIGIIVLFYKTIQMLIKQKRITEIKNDLINNITHEFKTPISTISLACEALNEPLLLSKEDSLKRYSGMINDENNRLRKLVENLLNTASIEKGDYNLKKEEIHLHDMLTQSIEKFKTILEQKDGGVKISFDAAIQVIKGDRFHLSNVLNNLIDNAIKYTKENPKLEISTWNNNGKINISIKDNGIGISRQNIDKIFDTFYRVSTGNIHDVKGYGIGLSYVKKLTEAHGGKISITSELNNGSEFIITFPVEK